MCVDREISNSTAISFWNSLKIGLKNQTSSSFRFMYPKTFNLLSTLIRLVVAAPAAANSWRRGIFFYLVVFTTLS